MQLYGFLIENILYILYLSGRLQGTLLAVHHDNYARFMPNDTSQMYAARNASLIHAAPGDA